MKKKYKIIILTDKGNLPSDWIYIPEDNMITLLKESLYEYKFDGYVYGQDINSFVLKKMEK